MEPVLKMEVTWTTPPPERPAPGAGGVGAPGGGGGGEGGTSTFERDNIEEVMLDMPESITNKLKQLPKYSFVYLPFFLAT